MRDDFWCALAATTAIGSVMLVNPAAAQGVNSTESTAAAEPADAGPEMGEIVVTAQRRSEALEKTPVAVSVVSGDTLVKEGITSERDLQFATPGLTVRTSQNDNQLNYSLRGQTVDAYSSSLPSVLPYFNEVQVGGAGSTAFYDLNSVQVIKGPQGTLFGRNSTGGAVLFTTAKPTEELSGYASAGYGRFNDIQAEGAVSGPLVGDDVLFRLAASYRNRDGYQHNIFYDTDLGKVDRLGVRLSLSFNPHGKVSDELVADFFHANGSNISPVVNYVVPLANNVPGNPFVPANLLFPGLVAFGAAQNARGPYDNDVDSLSVHRDRKGIVSNITNFELNDTTKIKNVAGYVYDNYFDASDIDGTRYGIDGRGNATTGAYGGDGLIQQFSEELQALGKVLSDRLDYVVGTYYSNSKEHLRNTSFILNGIGVPPQINAGTTTSKSIAGYGQGTFDTGFAGFKVTGGLRYTSERVTFIRDADDQWKGPAFADFYASGKFIPLQTDRFNKLSSTFGLQNQIAPDWLLYLDSRRSFRSGGFNFHGPPTPGFADSSGGEFRPEVATDVEFGAKYHGELAGMPVRMNLAVYNMWVDNIQRANYVAIYGALASVTANVPKAIITGFELDGSLKPEDWLTFGGNLNYTEARFTDNRVAVLGTNGATTYAAFNTYPDTPKWSGALYADVTVPVSSSWNFDLRGDVFDQASNYFSSTGHSLNPGTLIPGYALVNFRLGLDESTAKGWSVSALIKNAFNRTYYTGGIGFASLFALNVTVPGEPRTYLLDARYRF